MLTARTTESDRVLGLDVGADDYVSKPFSLRELAARVRAVLRRGRTDGAAAAPPVFQGRHLSPTSTPCTITVDGEPIRLTRREFELLRFLVENSNRVDLARSPARARVGIRPDGRNAVRRRARRPAAKQARDAGRQIETVVGLGYRFVEYRRQEGQEGQERIKPEGPDLPSCPSRPTCPTSALAPAAPPGSPRTVTRSLPIRGSPST